ncbi:phosphoribosylaminoimidazole-succinocarboxamide synthase [Breznakia sp. PF5-3]|uniref:phosphoribosylaminoimidazolesuccinocarboxamide synthase n=1 Tax=unclassified Breznakia TaxID=2623764 RepID=UPI002404980B|nr:MULTISPECIES: phosphoribosylaminoimidazolesuccinocarboxamide synthase [unclassified Breznakia]MDF9825615.1 phosphoribosylaminoimidazole-succinocarboxamide synthase [Breznakia sp. PM6-1]MDF9836442.1 phosphoribosylaminoimidazole-succinocarboxamide synthase [Breznakia sp. PF5-3]MDF9838356.1 phosphoribosylaminoimidazole-succinocarboxamide synthase [Breznakia sp. PFB2-8]MDF9860352.1 phosphoribosylaminoimidazole-succinocarboxamide synthase [Breznakia sp. PH5-24]
MKMLYEGKAKQIFATDDPEEVIIHYKDDATAGNGEKKGTIENKGVLNNKISSLIYQYLMKYGVRTHFIKTLNERDQLCKKVEIVPLEVIVRNAIAGSAAKAYHLQEGTALDDAIIEICWKDDALGDPLINDYHAVAFGLATKKELEEIYTQTKKINELMVEMWDTMGIRLIDFKIEFGKTSDGEILLADEISPDTCRLWDKNTNEKLDKDRFRRDMGNVEEAYAEIFARLEKKGA